MFHCVIPCASNLQRPIRIYTPSKASFRRQRIVNGTRCDTRQGPCSSSQNSLFTTDASKSAAVARFNKFTRKLQLSTAIDNFKKRKSVPHVCQRTEGESAKSSSANVASTVSVAKKDAVQRKSTSLYRRFCYGFPTISPKTIQRVIQYCQRVVCTQVNLHDVVIQKSNFLGRSSVNSSLRLFALKRVVKKVFQMLVLLEFHRNWSSQYKPSSMEMHLNQGKLLWSYRLTTALRNALEETGVIVQRERTTEEMQKTWTSWKCFGSNFERLGIDVENLTPLFTLQDLTKQVAGLPEKLTENGASMEFWLQVDLPHVSLPELRDIYTELSPLYDNYIPDYFEEDYMQRMKRKEDILNAALKQRDVLKVRQLCRLGCCAANRDAAWTLLLRDKTIEKTHYTKCLADFVRTETYFDHLMTKSVVDIIGNSDQFFNFIQLTHQVMQLFQRDCDICERLLEYDIEILQKIHPFQHQSCDAMDNAANTNECECDSHDLFPPSRVLPFHEISMYAAPLAYVFLKPRPCYFAFRELYIRHFHYLSELSTHPQSILSLYCLFERLLYERESELWEHLRKTIKVELTEFVVPWLTMAYAGFIEVDQLLLLWDRIIGYNDLRILSLLALGIFMIRKYPLLKSKQEKEVEAALCDILNVEIVPLLQMVLFI
ncbi:TBC1 domain family member 19-like isoform X1 [Paramacrobiotus metropolitanus]|uniref:TBC1 domain family member 19-like isoform X1 n=1 Tax=Paramacrobiotus metropolitanus TaxID=2943436 RepID=UPI0024463F2D|nr:TBC1 domain family member 19-like isoform X1 [Paramacrobiotus metropolitanus]